MVEYVKMAESLSENALALRGTEQSWKYLKTVGDIKVFTKQSPNFGGTAYKFVAEIDAPKDVVYSMMKPPRTTNERLSWDKSVAHYERLETINESIAIGLILTHPVMGGMISAREFVDLYCFKTFDTDPHPDYANISWIFAQSVTHHSRPVTKSFVRATNYPAGYAIAQKKSNSSQSYLELFVNTDIGGMIPRYLVESALPSQQASYIQSIRNEVKRRMQ
uniref:StAR-related lipid transfer protein 5-like n=1 Tax=Phallusia mammillata TaxID=59560 RepID=A0A6F9DUD1_9ASCI|nr:stAR-related lipid transfer protein 5-like [Phallusia mammillata]